MGPRGAASAFACALSLAATALTACQGGAISTPTPSSAVAKVKNLLVGLPPTGAEVAAVQADPDALATLVTSWMSLPQYNAKMLQFFITAFQQDGVTYPDLEPQFFQQAPFDLDQPQFMQDVSESFGRTVMALIAEGQPFTSTFTTHRFMMTPALMAAYATLDSLPVSDANSADDQFARAHPTSMTLESAEPIPIEEAANGSSPYFMTFYDPSTGLDYASGCPEGVLQYPSPVSLLALVSFLYNYVPSAAPVVSGPGGLCVPPQTPAGATYIRASDFTTWQMVTVRQPQPGESTTPPYALPAMRAGANLVLDVPRVGFFTTLAFLGRWATNDSNQARVTLNQALIVALGEPINLTNSSEPASLAALDATHASPGTSCYGCHQSLDPMRQFFRHDYSLYFSEQTDPVQLAMPGEFAFHGVTIPGTAATGIFSLAADLAAHPMVAPAWVQRLCTYATSTECDETSPEFVRLVTLFRESGFSWDALVQAVFSSPLVTYLPSASTPPSASQTFPVARQGHLCATLSARLGIDDVCGLGVPYGAVSPDVQAIASTWPSDEYTRGSQFPVLANSPSPFLRGGIEGICASLANLVVDNPVTGQFSSTAADAAIQSFTTNLMGLTSDRSAAPLQILRGHFSSAEAAGAAPSDALKSTFMLACMSPYVVGIGQ